MNRKKCWGIGLGRTGTRSLCEAFKILGFENVKHVPPFMSDLDDVDAAAEGICMSHYAYLDLRFPDSKFILTTRNIEPWLDSCQRAMKDFPKERITPESEFYNAMIRNRAARYGSLVFDRNKLIKKYYQHHFDVVNFFSGREDQLLVIDLTEGIDQWEKICQFLTVDLPSEKFPQISGKQGIKS